jgi:hypothetical protein
VIGVGGDIARPDSDYGQGAQTLFFLLRHGAHHWRRAIQSVRLITTEHMKNLHGAAIVIEPKPHAPLSNAKPIFGRRDALKP